MKHIEDILQQAGYPVDLSKDDDIDNAKELVDNRSDAAAILAHFEVWLGLRSKTTTSSVPDELVESEVTVEDCLPLSDAVFAAAIDWLVDAWNESSNSYGNSAFKMGSTSSHQSILTMSSMPTLEESWDCIRATRLLRSWMEFRLVDDACSNDESTMSENPHVTSTDLSRRLLQVDAKEITNMVSTTAATAVASTASNNTDSTNQGIIPAYIKTSARNGILRALYQHVQDLPTLQQQLLLYNQRLQRGNVEWNNKEDPHTTAGAAADASIRHNNNKNMDANQTTTRLQQYQESIQRANELQQEWLAHIERLQYILGDFYVASNTQQRQLCRRLLGHVWSSYILQSSSSSTKFVSGGTMSLRQENTSAAAISMTLKVLRRILLGGTHNINTTTVSTTAPLSTVEEHLLFQQLIPLHKANGIVLWRDQTPVLELYHEPLCQCIAILLQRDTHQLVPTTIQQLLSPNIFPLVGSTGKQVLLLHEIDTYLRLLEPLKDNGTTNKRSASDSSFTNSNKLEREMMHTLLTTVAHCTSSEHSRVAERALQFFQNNTPFEQLVSRHLELTCRILLPALVRHEPSWNPTVRKMTYYVLKKLQQYDGAVFETACNQLFSQIERFEEKKDVDEIEMRTSSLVAAQLEEAASTRAMAPTATDFSLKAGMGTWKPPSSLPTGAESGSSIMPPPTSRRPIVPGKGRAPWANMPTLDKSSSAAPPLTITGVAPWASIPSRVEKYGSGGNAPPLTVTGVAPWAMKPPTTVHRHKVAPETPLNTLAESAGSTNVVSSKTGLEYVLDNMEKIKPPHEEEGISSWSKAQMAETPTYLPHLKFHDLVFGHDLGSGAFGSVKYARLIDKTKSRSQWPEYAVKVISTEKIRALGYEMSVQREIAVLRYLSHPGIARLVSSFRFQDGAYLVLEYASRGDLHTLLHKHGSLDAESTKFVIGEVVAALASIHDSGFVFADLKPENIVITESGHIKLTDFGGCRPVTQEAKALMKSVTKDLLKNLRDGDWKPVATKSTRADPHRSRGFDSDNEESSDKEGNNDGSDMEEDVRIEGTTSYLPPEVILGAFPTVAADAWALGCVTYQCLSGRPPLLEADDSATRNRIVSFDFNNNSGNGSDVDRLFEDKHAVGISSVARDMIKSCLDRNPLKRPRMMEIAEHEFFGGDVFALYDRPAYPLDVGTVAPTQNAQWARRQFSSIWAPQPEAYNVSLPGLQSKGPIDSGVMSDAPIPEGDEASGYFSSSGLNSAVSTEKGKNATRQLLPPV